MVDHPIKAEEPMAVTEMDTLEQVEAMEDSMDQLQEDYPEKTHDQEWKSSEINLGIKVTTLHGTRPLVL